MYYQVMNTMKLNGYSLIELNEMIPYEVDIFAALLKQAKEKEKQSYGK